MIHLTNRLLCVVATAITLLGVLTSAEARDKQKCRIMCCQPVPTCCAPQSRCCTATPAFAAAVQPLTTCDNWACVTEDTAFMTVESINEHGDPITISFWNAQECATGNATTIPGDYTYVNPPCGNTPPCNVPSTPSGHCLYLGTVDVNDQLKVGPTNQSSVFKKGVGKVHPDADYKPRDDDTKVVTLKPRMFVKFLVTGREVVARLHVTRQLKRVAKGKDEWIWKSDFALGEEIDPKKVAAKDVIDLNDGKHNHIKITHHPIQPIVWVKAVGVTYMVVIATK